MFVLELKNGRKVKSGKLIRSGRLSDLTDFDKQVLCEKWNVTTIVDLRNEQEILDRLKATAAGFRLSDLFAVGARGEKVAAFLGVLELLKMGSITISQSEQFAPIYIFAKQGEE